MAAAQATSATSQNKHVLQMQAIEERETLQRDACLFVSKAIDQLLTSVNEAEDVVRAGSDAEAANLLRLLGHLHEDVAPLKKLIAELVRVSEHLGALKKEVDLRCRRRRGRQQPCTAASAEPPLKGSRRQRGGSSRPRRHEQRNESLRPTGSSLGTSRYPSRSPGKGDRARPASQTAEARRQHDERAPLGNPADFATAHGHRQTRAPSTSASECRAPQDCEPRRRSRLRTPARHRSHSSRPNRCLSPERPTKASRSAVPSLKVTQAMEPSAALQQRDLAADQQVGATAAPKKVDKRHPHMTVSFTRSHSSQPPGDRGAHDTADSYPQQPFKEVTTRSVVPLPSPRSRHQSKLDQPSRPSAAKRPTSGIVNHSEVGHPVTSKVADRGTAQTVPPVPAEGAPQGNHEDRKYCPKPGQKSGSAVMVKPPGKDSEDVDTLLHIAQSQTQPKKNEDPSTVAAEQKSRGKRPATAAAQTRGLLPTPLLRHGHVGGDNAADSSTQAACMLGTTGKTPPPVSGNPLASGSTPATAVQEIVRKTSGEATSIHPALRSPGLVTTSIQDAATKCSSRPNVSLSPTDGEHAESEAIHIECRLVAPLSSGVPAQASSKDSSTNGTGQKVLPSPCKMAGTGMEIAKRKINTIVPADQQQDSKPVRDVMTAGREVELLSTAVHDALHVASEMERAASGIRRIRKRIAASCGRWAQGTRQMLQKAFCMAGLVLLCSLSFVVVAHAVAYVCDLVFDIKYLGGLPPT